MGHAVEIDPKDTFSPTTWGVFFITCPVCKGKRAVRLAVKPEDLESIDVLDVRQS